jgi:hypothetical protein
MITRRNFLQTGTALLSLLLLLIPAIPGQAAAGRIQAVKWTPADLEFTTSITWKFSPTDPFEVEFYADIAGPGNLRLKHQGFYDGKDTWKIRFAPPAEGVWTVTTHSDVLELDNRQVEVHCTAAPAVSARGGLRIDPTHPRHFIREDGTRLFPVGYEANWLFALDMLEPGPALPTLTPFLAKLAGSGFNFVNLNLWALDTTWRAGKTEENDFGPPALSPWEGEIGNPDFRRFNLAYWQHLDRVIAALADHGFFTNLYLKVYNKLCRWPANGSPEDERYFRYAIARYAGYPNVIWNLAKEAQYEKSTRYKVERLKYIRATDPYHRLVTVHDDRLTYDRGHYDQLVDFRSPQEHEDVFAVIARQRAHRGWPIFVAESGYEHGPGGLQDKTFGRSHTPQNVIENIWNLQMSGVYNAYYYTYTAWDVIRHQDSPPGYEYIKIFADFFNRTTYWKLQPDQSLVSAGRCLATPGEEYVAYQSEAVPFTLNIPRLPNSHAATWFHPFTGQTVDAGPLAEGKNQVSPPAAWGKAPVVLHVRAAQRPAATTRPDRPQP